ncbi:hypothetical protein FSP39_019758 [Pinctada imbricata]|uniref:Short-chain collagen C4-like n=1 Tax=Pinctada imbricata TaxID=66713 RepID=A0AA88Y5G7_PINIB|nr:hypothetical protein FSP39_019758 [Pinctada imbricata]
MVGGSDSYKQSGAAVDHLCLPPDPIYDRYDPKVNDQAYVFGAEYDIWNIDVKGTLFDKAKYTQKGVPCAVCRPTTPSSVIMIPENKGRYGEMYTRWGKDCCRNGSQLVYSGRVGGSNNYKHSGAAVDYLCLPSNPIYEKYDPKVNNQAFVFGAEYDIWNINIPGTLFDKSRYTEKGVPCAVCRPTTPSNVIMIPGRNACYKGMREEYRGYLMAGYYSHVGASEYICVDRDAGTITPKVHSWKKILYAVESMCGGPMECPPYINGAEMTCVVCSL